VKHFHQQSLSVPICSSLFPPGLVSSTKSLPVSAFRIMSQPTRGPWGIALKHARATSMTPSSTSTRSVRWPCFAGAAPGSPPLVLLSVGTGDEHPPDQSAKVPDQATTSLDSRSSASRMRFATGTSGAMPSDRQFSSIVGRRAGMTR